VEARPKPVKRGSQDEAAAAKQKLEAAAYRRDKIAAFEKPAKYIYYHQMTPG